MSAGPETTAERERDLERLLTFVDAIVAIAITLLVLPLVDLAGQLDRGSVTALLDSHQGQIWAFFLSFAVISNLWLAQHRLLHNVVATDRLVERLLLLWTLSIVVLPFPTALVAQDGASRQAATELLYVGTMTVSAILLSLIGLAITRRPEIRDSDEVPDQRRAVATVVAFALALALMLGFPGLSYWPLLLLALRDRVVAAWERLRSSR